MGDGPTPATASPSEARAAVVEAVDARRGRPALPVPLGLAITRPLDTDTTTGLALGFVPGALGDALGLIKGWAAVPHDLRATRHHLRTTRVTKQFMKAAKGSRPGAGDDARVAAFRRAIVEGSIFNASMGVCMLYMELAGHEATAEEVREKRSPLWPAWAFRLGRTAKPGEPESAWTYLTEAFATGDPVWATAAGIELLDLLDEVQDSEFIASMVEWIERYGDAAVAIELLFYRS